MRQEAELATTLLSREYPTESSLVTRDTEFVANPSGASSLKVSGGLPVNLRVPAALIALTMAVTGPTVGHAQSALDKLKKITEQSKDLVNDARDATKEARDAAGAAKELRCDVQRDACGNVTASTGFNPSRYKTLAVALTTKGARYGNVDLDQIVRIEFENAIVRQGFAAAPAPDARRIQKRIDAEEDLSDQRLSQIRDFAKNIDAVLVVEAGNVEVARCVTHYQVRQGNGQTVGEEGERGTGEWAEAVGEYVGALGEQRRAGHSVDCQTQNLCVQSAVRLGTRRCAHRADQSVGEQLAIAKRQVGKAVNA